MDENEAPHSSFYAALKRSELQKLAKENGIPANGKNVEIIRALEALKLHTQGRLNSGLNGNTPNRASFPLTPIDDNILGQRSTNQNYSVGFENGSGGEGGGAACEAICLMVNITFQPSRSSIPKLAALSPKGALSVSPGMKGAKICENGVANSNQVAQQQVGSIVNPATPNVGNMERISRTKKTGIFTSPKVLAPTEVPPDISAAVHAEFEARVRQQKRSSIPRRSPLKALKKLIPRDNAGVVDATTPSGKFVVAHEKEFKRMEGIDRHYLAKRARSRSKQPVARTPDPAAARDVSVPHIACGEAKTHGSGEVPTAPITSCSNGAFAASKALPTKSVSGATPERKSHVPIRNRACIPPPQPMSAMPAEKTETLGIHSQAAIEPTRKRKAEESITAGQKVLVPLNHTTVGLGASLSGKTGKRVKPLDVGGPALSRIVEKPNFFLQVDKNPSVSAPSVSAAPPKTRVAQPSQPICAKDAGILGRQRKVFDIQASLKKPLTYVPHKGVLPKFCPQK
ncbi:hypothetical protein M427DRAFT_53269 [Gonapodya prolifera JEL478]|uniref:SAP domain-containing protein n=1 Tax=Gonapodya prolifera (strain JEL478) TaxID=1344416 RepID=A0A139ARJ3_GONPJ|nr:hypothetical protein M427DRAFT_53269 [Gonapodya prolifera JEL478]|eukprot:KXS19342.1 hypothetical protein M427DRAFT_53269 [Gonapodya prolifera JEL478]